MKKTYISPEMEVIKIQLTNIIAASLYDVSDTGGSTNLTDESADDGDNAW